MTHQPGELASFPQILPDNRALLFTLQRSLYSAIVVQYLETGERRQVIKNGTDAIYVSTGHLLYTNGSSLYAVPFDLPTLSPIGGAVPLLTGLRRTNANAGERQTRFTVGGQYTISNNGSLVYLPGIEDERELVWLDRNGNTENVGAPPVFYEAARLSPTAEYIAVVRDSEIWVHDLRRDGMSRLTYTGDNTCPVWSPDSRTLFFSSGRTGADQVFRKPVDGAWTRCP